MKVKALIIVLYSAVAAFITGCAPSVGSMSGQTGTSVALTGKNYKLVKPGAMGTSSGFNLLGIIPFASPNYATAKASLYESVGQPLTGRAVALANQTQDRSTLYLILFSIPKLTITADVVEFVDEPVSAKAPEAGTPSPAATAQTPAASAPAPAASTVTNTAPK